MITDKAQVAVGAALVGVFAGFWRWHSPPAKKLTRDEIDHYLEIISGYPARATAASSSPGCVRGPSQTTANPILMLNLLRYFPELRRFPGAADFHGTPEEANAYYEKRLTPLWLRKASYPLAGGTVLGENLIQTQPMRENWSTAMMVRYPSRRTFLQLLADPTYADLDT